jgi:hypothetical protein
MAGLQPVLTVLIDRARHARGILARHAYARVADPVPVGRGKEGNKNR